MTKFRITIVCAAALLPAQSYATLGAALAPVAPLSAAAPAARSALQAATPSARYSVREARDADGVTVREYAAPDNVVFAVTWDGPVRPDMSALLGSYFPNFVSVARRNARGTGPLVAADGNLQIESIGHQGSFVGKAWLPRLVPKHVDPAELP